MIAPLFFDDLLCGPSPVIGDLDEVGGADAVDEHQTRSFWRGEIDNDVARGGIADDDSVGEEVAAQLPQQGGDALRRQLPDKRLAGQIGGKRAGDGPIVVPYELKYPPGAESCRAGSEIAAEVVERLALFPIAREVALFPSHRPLFGAVEENFDAFVVVARVAIDTAHPALADEKGSIKGKGGFFFWKNRNMMLIS